MPDYQDRMKDYVPVNERIDAFMTAFPEGSLQTEIVELTDSRVTVKAYAYRVPTDPRPGVGHSSLNIPGSTPYTKGSEIENAETSAWGRAIAALGFEVKRGIASSEEVRNKQQPRPVKVNVTRDVVPDPPMEVEEFIEKVLDATGGEEVDDLPPMSEYADDKPYSPPNEHDVVEVTPSAVKNVGRGGTTDRANSAQTGAVKAYSKSLGLGPHGMIEIYNELFAASIAAPQDRKQASDLLLTILDAMSSTNIGLLIQHLEKMPKVTV